MTGEKMKSLSFLTGFGDPDSSSEIRGLELRPELMPRAFSFGARLSDAASHEMSLSRNYANECAMNGFLQQSVAVLEAKVALARAESASLKTTLQTQAKAAAEAKTARDAVTISSLSGGGVAVVLAWLNLCIRR